MKQFIGQVLEPKKKRVRKPYVTNKQLLVELKIYKETGKFTEKFGEYIMLMAKNIASKPNFAGYTYISEMCLEAVMTTLMYVKNFDPEKSQNPFAYISQIIFNAFRCYLNKEKKISNTKKELFDLQQINSNCVNDDDNQHWHMKKNIKDEIEKKLNYLAHIEKDDSFCKGEYKVILNNPKTKTVSIMYVKSELDALELTSKYIIDFNNRFPDENYEERKGNE